MCMPHTADRRDRADRRIDGEAWMKCCVFLYRLLTNTLAHTTHTQDARSDFTQNRDQLAPVRSGSPQLTRKQRTRHRSRVFLLLHTRYTRCRGVCMEVLTGIRVCCSRGVNSLTPRRRSSRRCKSCTGSRPRRGERRTPSASSRRKAAACRRRRRGKSPAPEQA